jgi:hypothetical protein
MHRLVNEKTLELNLTHELMASLNIQFYGFTQQQEYFTGADVQFRPIGNPVIIQYKAMKNGIDGDHGTFFLNDNTNNNQHDTLDMISRSGMVDAYYYFPLIMTDRFLLHNFNRLLLYNIPIEANRITQQHNWKIKHTIYVDRTGAFNVHSDYTHNDSSEKMNNHITYLRNKIYRSEIINEEIGEYIHNIISKIESLMDKNKIYGASEHTFYFFLKNIKKQQTSCFQIPILIHGPSNYKFS